MGDTLKKWRCGEIYNRLYFTSHQNDEHTLFEINKNKSYFYFSTDIHETYNSYCLDFCPINIYGILRFNKAIQDKINDPRLKNRKIIYYCGNNEIDRTNVALLLSCYLLIVHNFTPENAILPFKNILLFSFLTYRDASYNIQDCDISIEDCLHP